MTSKQILVIDDEPIVGHAINLTLQSDGHVIEVVLSPYDALERFEVGKYDLVLTDFKMPGMTGLELAGQIKARDPAQPIILITAAPPFPPAIVFDLIILKPFSNLELRKVVGAFAKRECH